MSTRITDPLVGKTVAQYEVLAKLGGGGMGVVYTARDVKLARLVALKFLPPQWSHDESAKQRFIREAQAASATDHRNICTIHNIESTSDGQLFIVMAHYEGQTLKQRLEGAALSLDEALDIAAQVAEGLAKAHAQGVVHRDIKPGNLMITEDGVKILDFGLAKFAGARFQLTLEGSTVGTIAYMSPEQARGEEADARSDIWALGVVLYEMLSGERPFKGAYPEAISYAIKNEPPPPLRTPGRDISEALEQLVFRALHKDPNVRFQTARDLARALRLLQGRTIPVDLRTEPLSVETAHDLRPSRHWGISRKGLGAAAALIALMLGTPLWVFSPIERVPVAVAPVVNQTGYPELDAYRLALTQELVSEMFESRRIRVLPYDRVLQIVRRFRVAGQDVSSRDAIQALTTQSGAQVIVAPTLLYENGAWRARIEFRNAGTATNEATDETNPVVTSLMKDAAYSLMSQVAVGVEEHFANTGPRRASVADFVRRLAADTPAAALPRLRTLDAAAAFEQGLDAYEQQEFGAALSAFTAASEHDPRSPLLFAWRSRVAQMMRQDEHASTAAEQAVRLLTDQTPPLDRLFIEAVVAEARRDVATAETRYRSLVDRHPDEPAWTAELAAFLDRQLRSADAVASYHETLRLDDRLARPHLELCRLYGPLRLNDPPNAKVQAQLALAQYRVLGSRAGEAQTLWCLADVSGVGGDAERTEARRHADLALRIFEELGYDYNLSRAYNYVALAAVAQGRLAEAASFWERSLTGSRAAGNAGLEPAVLTNLGVAYEALGNRARAVEYRQQGHKLFEALGDQQRAAQNQANGAALVIEYGGNLEQGVRDIRNALAVFQKLNDRNFEVFCLQVIAAYDRYAGRHGDAERELNRALAIARERNLEDEIATSTIDLARSRFDLGDYARARDLLLQALATASGPDSTHARIHLGRTSARLGDFEAARTELTQAASDLQKRGDTGLAPLLTLALGELAYESGHLDEARRHFAATAALWADEMPDPASVEGRAYLGLLDALEGKSDRGRANLLASLSQARKMGRFSLETRCRVYLARIEIIGRRADAALRMLNDIPPDDEARTGGRELRAQVHHWRARALAQRGDQAGARAEMSAAHKIVDDLRAALPPRYQDTFAARSDLRFPIE